MLAQYSDSLSVSSNLDFVLGPLLETLGLFSDAGRNRENTSVTAHLPVPPKKLTCSGRALESGHAGCTRLSLELPHTKMRMLQMKCTPGCQKHRLSPSQ